MLAVCCELVKIQKEANVVTAGCVVECVGAGKEGGSSGTLEVNQLPCRLVLLHIESPLFSVGKGKLLKEQCVEFSRI